MVRQPGSAHADVRCQLGGVFWARDELSENSPSGAIGQCGANSFERFQIDCVDDGHRINNTQKAEQFTTS